MAATATAAIYLDEDRQRWLQHALNRVEGHIGGVKRMVEERRCADEVLAQVAAARGMLSRIAVEIVEQELRLCLTQCGAARSEERFDDAMRTLASMLKH